MVFLQLICSNNVKSKSMKTKHVIILKIEEEDA